MSKQNLKKEIQSLQRTIKRAPRIWKFRGRLIVRDEDWKYGDWSKLPDQYDPLLLMGADPPKDWVRSYLALMDGIRDPNYGWARCLHCAINEAQDRKKEIERGEKYWRENGGEEARRKFYETCGEPKTSEFQRQDSMQEVEWRLYNEAAGAENRTCQTINYYQCPYPDERDALIEDGRSAYILWLHIQWYDRHWNPSTSWTPLRSDGKGYHIGEPAIIDVKSFEDIMKALDDGRIMKIIIEHKRYMKETGAKIWSL